MKILLTSSGITNTTIHDALVDLLGKPIAESSALCIPTGVQPFPGGPSHVYGFLTGTVGGPMCALGWKSLGVLELTALPSIKKEHWSRLSRKSMRCWSGEGARCICATGCGNPGSPTSCRRCGPRPCMWVRAAERWWRLPTSEARPTTTSSRSPAATKRWDWSTSRCLWILHPGEEMPATPLADIERWAAGLSVPAYAIDDQTAIRVVDGNVEVVSEGHWKLFTPSTEAS